MSTLAAVGLMSGTSFDGVDVALIETDGETIARLGPTGFRAYTDADRALLRAAMAEAASLTDRRARPGVLAEAEGMVTRVHVHAVNAFLKAHGIDRREVAVVGFHGQTVLHRPRERLTVQIGDGAALAKSLGFPVVHDFRAADVAAGGEGAPLAPIYHQALVRHLGNSETVVVLNLGGVGNITYLAGTADPIAFDTGPANAPIDDLVHARTGADRDDDGRLAAAGKVREDLVAEILRDAFFDRPPPKSLDRAQFARLPLDGLSLEDAAATATAVVAASVARALEHMPARPTYCIVAGGGTRNPTLMHMLETRLRMPIRPAGEVGWSSDALEAQAFAYMAMRTVKGLPITFPSTTGVPRPMVGGVVAAAR